MLEIGPGSGNQLPRYDVSKIDRVYGVEPNVDLHAALRGNIKKCGLSDVYTIVPCGVENLEELGEYGVLSGSVDTVVSVKVLCSVPKPAEMTKELYRLLKPGGQMIVYEHVKSEDYVSQLVQCRCFRPGGVERGLTLQKWYIISSGHTLWATAAWIVVLNSTCSRLVAGLRLSWKRRRRRMLGWSFRMFLGDLSSGVLVRDEIF